MNSSDTILKYVPCVDLLSTLSITLRMASVGSVVSARQRITFQSSTGITSCLEKSFENTGVWISWLTHLSKHSSKCAENDNCSDSMNREILTIEWHTRKLDGTVGWSDRK